MQKKKNDNKILLKKYGKHNSMEGGRVAVGELLPIIFLNSFLTIK